MTATPEVLLNQFTTECDFDAQTDMLCLDFDRQQTLYVGLVNDEWAVGCHDPTMSVSALQRLREQDAMFPNPLGLRVDTADIGSYVLMSAAGYSLQRIWRSQLLLTSIMAVRRQHVVGSDVVLESNY